VSGDAALVLAAGKGTRMKSRLPKVLHRLAGKPMLLRVLDSLADAGFPDPTVIVGYGADQIRDSVGDRCRYVLQEQQGGTGDAARVGAAALAPSVRRVLVVHGDEPMISGGVYREMLGLQSESGAPVVLLTTHAADARGFGRVIREAGTPVALVQEADLAPEQKALTEVNLGAYVFDAAFLRDALSALEPHPPKNELYLTDLVGMAVRRGYLVEAVTIPGGMEVMGVNDLIQLEETSHAVYRATNRRLMAAGVTILDSASTFIDEDAVIAPDTIIHPFTIIEGAASIGSGCRIGPNSHITSSAIGDDCTVIASTIRDSWLDRDVVVGPYAHLRPGTRIGRGVHIGTHAEVKGSTFGAGSRMHHFGYVGDAEIGERVNIGAGTVTCNFDGREKHRTRVGDDAFIGSDTMLRAPLQIGERSYTGAGSVVTHDVAPGERVAGVPARPLPDRGETREAEQGAS
jgi:bifunctional UDP-N-acetylglucosamine pyrophosphorylase/glucosamine-1-phosphate N-acetyltransferase